MIIVYLLQDPVSPLLGIYPREIKTYVHLRTIVGMFIVLFITVKNWETK